MEATVINCFDSNDKLLNIVALLDNTDNRL